MRKETIAKKVETNVELEQLRESISQCSAAASLNEVYRTQLRSIQQELITERSRSNEERIHLEENIDRLKADIHNEKAKCKRYEEEKLRNNTVITKLEERLKRSECDKHFFQQQMHELIIRLPACEYELQMSKETIKKLHDETILWRIENDKLKEACERLNKTNEVNNELKTQLENAEETKSDLLGRLKEQERSLSVGDEETLDPFTTPNSTSEENSLISDLIVNFENEFDIEKRQRKELEDKLTYATEQLKQLDCKTQSIEIAFVSKGLIFFSDIVHAAHRSHDVTK